MTYTKRERRGTGRSTRPKMQPVAIAPSERGGSDLRKIDDLTRAAAAEMTRSDIANVLDPDTPETVAQKARAARAVGDLFREVFKS